jgi:hypothetical protein
MTEAQEKRVGVRPTIHLHFIKGKEKQNLFGVNGYAEGYLNLSG